MMYHKLLVSALIHKYTTIRSDRTRVSRFHIEEVYDMRHLLKFEFKDLTRPPLIICVSVQHILIMSGKVIMVDTELDLGHTVKHHKNILQQIIDFIELKSEKIVIKGDINHLIQNISPENSTMACTALGAFNLLLARNHQLGYKFYDYDKTMTGTLWSIRDRVCREFEEEYSEDGAELELQVKSELNDELCVVVIRRVSHEFHAYFDEDWDGGFQFFSNQHRPEDTLTINTALGFIHRTNSKKELEAIWGDLL